MKLRWIPGLLALIYLLVIGIYDYAYERPQLRGFMERTAEGELRRQLAMRKQLLQALYQQQQLDIIRQWLAIIRAQQGNDVALLIGAEGRVVAAGDEALEGRDLAQLDASLSESLGEFMRSNRNLAVLPGSRPGQSYSFIRLRDVAADGRRGERYTYFVGSRDLHRFYYQLGQLQSRSALFEAVLLGLLLAALLPIGWHSLWLRLRSIERTCNGFAEGNTALRVRDSKIYELAEVGRSVNAMLDALCDWQARVAQQSRYLERVYQSIDEGVVSCNSAGEILHVNQQLLSMFEYQAETDLLGRSVTELMPEGMRSAHDKRLQAAADSKRLGLIIQNISALALKAGGQKFPVSITVAASDIDGERIFTAFISDRTEANRAKREIEQLAYTNQVSGLMNRNGLKRLLTKYRELPEQKSHWLLLAVGVDRLNDINTSLGYQFGDRVIAELGQRLLAEFSDCQFVAHIGSDRMLLGCAIDADTERWHFNDICGRLSQLELSCEQPTGGVISFSVGVGATCETADSDMLQVLQNAELALSEAKQQGESGRYLLALSDKARLQEAAEIARDIPRALTSGEFFLTFQPKVRLKDGRVGSAECLLRWRTAAGEMIPPGKFIPIAENSSLIDSIGDWVLKKACQTLAEWRDAGLAPVPLAVNTSARQFNSPSFIASLGHLLAEHQLSPELLEIEITEYSLVEDIAAASRHINALHELGVRVSIDDFGTGQSNLATLMKLPIDHLKIDRSFIANAGDGDKGYLILLSIISMANMLQVETTAEGVETEAERDIVKALGCHQVQGYFYSKPLEEADFLEFIRVHNG